MLTTEEKYSTLIPYWMKKNKKFIFFRSNVEKVHFFSNVDEVHLFFPNAANSRAYSR
jgi:hypothetical protein